MTAAGPNELPLTMAAAVLTGHGGPDKLEYHTDWPTPTCGPTDVVVKVAAAAVNNTDINTRIGWYSKSISGGSNTAAEQGTPDDDTAIEAGGWSGALTFPRIQGADCCGYVVAVGTEVDPARIGERVLVGCLQRHPAGDVPWVTYTYGSEIDGGFAQYSAVHHLEAYPVDSDWTDVELASIPCAYSTAENMLHRIGVDAGDRVLITGASGGVGSAAVQLVKRRGTSVVAVVGESKADAVRSLGADETIDRDADLVAAFGESSFDVIVDVVAGPSWRHVTTLLRIGGRYITAGAIAGPIVELDVRDLYLKDLTLKGSTYQEAGVFENLIGYIERNEIRPVIAATYPLSEIAAAQEAFLDKGFVGKIVLVHPQ